MLNIKRFCWSFKPGSYDKVNSVFKLQFSCLAEIMEGLKDVGMLLMSVAPIRNAIKINGDNHWREKLMTWRRERKCLWPIDTHIYPDLQNGYCFFTVFRHSLIFKERIVEYFFKLQHFIKVSLYSRFVLIFKHL